jgi:hypothetical protein
MSCTTGKVITYPHSRANFPNYSTYKITSHEKIAEVSPQGYATYQRLDETISDQMEAKGYAYHLAADLIVRYEISSGLGQSTRRSYYDRFDWYFPDANYWDQNNQQAEILLELSLWDTEEKLVAWTGNADITLKRRDSAEELIKQKIIEILAQLPPSGTP